MPENVDHLSELEACAARLGLDSLVEFRTNVADGKAEHAEFRCFLFFLFFFYDVFFCWLDVKGLETSGTGSRLRCNPCTCVLRSCFFFFSLDPGVRDGAAVRALPAGDVGGRST